MPGSFFGYVRVSTDDQNLALQLDSLSSHGIPSSKEVFGLGIGIFFIGHLVLEIPGALLVEHRSARKWFARSLITWALISSATAFA